MTAIAVPAGIVPPRPAWRSLLWIVLPTLHWTLLIYWPHRQFRKAAFRPPLPG
jgi:hypothetical protein